MLSVAVVVQVLTWGVAAMAMVVVIAMCHVYLVLAHLEVVLLVLMLEGWALVTVYLQHSEVLPGILADSILFSSTRDARANYCKKFTVTVQKVSNCQQLASR
jgi:hypothetical protein